MCGLVPGGYVQQSEVEDDSRTKLFSFINAVTNETMGEKLTANGLEVIRVVE